MRRYVAIFEVEVLSIYRRQKLCLHGLARAQFQVAPTSLLTLQTCGGGLCFGARQMNSRSALLRA